MSEPSSGTADEVLHLPSGGGAVAGIGSTVDVDLNTGTASAVLDLHLPTGPNAIRPEMTLRYHSGAGDGSFGPGWTLGLLTITRKLEPAPASRAQDFTLVGVADLLAMGDGRYRPAVDSTHVHLARRRRCAAPQPGGLGHPPPGAALRASPGPTARR
jgi:hypothetical protein